MGGNASVAFGLALVFARTGGSGAPLFATMWDVGTDADDVDVPSISDRRSSRRGSPSSRLRASVRRVRSDDPRECRA